MPIDRSGPTASLLAALQADITRRSERNRRERVDDDGARDATALRRQLVDIVRAAPGDDPQAQAAVQRRVIEAVLRWEFNAEGQAAPPMLEQLARTLQADPQHRARFDRLVRELRQR